MLLREVRVMKYLDGCDYVIKLINVYQNSTQICMIIEYADSGELLKLIQEKGKFSENEAREIFNQLLTATGYIHDRYIAHRDLKPENILISGKDENRKIKIIDWGFAILYDPSKKSLSNCGTLEYLAPECIDPKQEHTGYEPDIWALGVILFYMICGFSPFRAPHPFEIIQKIKSCKFDYGETPISEELNDLFTKIFVEHNKRPEIAELKKHSWLSLTNTDTNVKTQKKRERFREKRSVSAITTIVEIDENKLEEEPKESLLLDNEKTKKRRSKRSEGKKLKRSRSLVSKKKQVNKNEKMEIKEEYEEEQKEIKLVKNKKEKDNSKWEVPTLDFKFSFKPKKKKKKSPKNGLAELKVKKESFLSFSHNGHNSLPPLDALKLDDKKKTKHEIRLSERKNKKKDKEVPEGIIRNYSTINLGTN